MKTKTQDYDKDHKAVEEAVKRYASSFSLFFYSFNSNKKRLI